MPRCCGDKYDKTDSQTAQDDAMTGRTWMCWGTALVLFARAAALGDEPGALAPTVSDVLAQAKPDPDDKKKPADKKDKQPVPPPVVAEDTVPFEGRLEMRERTLPRAFEHLGDQPPPIIRTPIFLPVPVSAPVPVGGGGPGGAAGGGQNIVVLPGTRGFKVAENS